MIVYFGRPRQARPYLYVGVRPSGPFFIGLLLLHQHLSSWEAFVPAENMPNPFKSLLSHEDHEVAFVCGLSGFLLLTPYCYPSESP